MKRSLLVVLVASACTTGGGTTVTTVAPATATSPVPATAQISPSPTGTPASPPPSPSPTLAGDRRTHEMDAFSVSFILPRGWSLQAEPEWVNIMTLVGPNGSIDIARVRAAIDPSDRNGYETVEVGPTAADFVAWLVEHPHLEATTPVPVTIAGYAALQLDVRLRYVGDYGDRALCGGNRCLTIIQVTEKKTSADRLALVEGSGGDRFILLDVDDVRVLVLAYPKEADGFDAFMTEAEPVIGALMIH